MTVVSSRTLKGEASASPEASFVVTEKVWGPRDDNGLSLLLYKPGDRITEAEAIALGLKEAPKPRQIEDKKEAAPRSRKANPKNKE